MHGACWYKFLASTVAPSCHLHHHIYPHACLSSSTGSTSQALPPHPHREHTYTFGRLPQARELTMQQQQKQVRAGEGVAANIVGGRSGGGGVGGGAGGSVSVCRPSGSRWTPTPEQLRILKELYYGCGVRSPTAEQIQRITGTLRQHGKVEGKNVFYWFQNHKARERQKKRLVTNLDVNTPADDVVNRQLGILSLQSPSSGATPPSSTLGMYNGNGAGASAMQLDTTADWDYTANMDTEEGCFLQDYMGVRMTGDGTGVATSPWACFWSSDQRTTTTTTTRAPETLPLFPIGGDDNRPRPRQGGPAGDLSFCRGAADPAPAATASTTTTTTVTIQQHQLLQMQQQYKNSFYSSNNTHLQLTSHYETQHRAAGSVASLELSLSSWCSPYHAGTM